MNTANRLTLLRVILVPFYMAFLLNQDFKSQMLALLIFIVASLTDALDGHIARKYHQITPFGKFVDPLADKILTTSAFLVFMSQDIISVWAVMIILTREFVVAGIRLSAVTEGEVIAASMLGKIKTVSQMTAIIAATLILNISAIPHETAVGITNVFVWISVVLTVLSGVDYLMKNKSLLRMK